MCEGGERHGGDAVVDHMKQEMNDEELLKLVALDIHAARLE